LNEVNEMTHDTQTTNDSGRESVLADLYFWSVAALVVAAFSKPLADTWGAPRVVLVGVAAVIFVLGLSAVMALRRVRPLPTRLIRTFGAGNILTTLVALAASSGDWLHLSGAGNTALATVAGITLLFGAWQLVSARSGNHV